MAKLSSFRLNKIALEQGEWISPGDEYDDLEIRTRGLTDQYRDALAAKLRRAATGFGGDQSKIPGAIFRRHVVDALREHVLLDVRNIEDDAGKPLAFADFCKLLADVEYSDLREACLRAAAMVGRVAQEDKVEAAGFSAPA
ncbi:hypothetical protein [Roseomonas sp. USHLN139]|uniref:hypothetical protein n=1 Tax=Roseomonas sp. USHLN139 TaxID=3081298 RepID=UPI003B01D16F